MIVWPKIPTILKVGALDYEILELDPVVAAEDSIFGRVSHDECWIKIVKRYGYRRAVMTMLHEIEHIVEKMLELEKRKDDEERIMVKSFYLAGIWRDNPEVFEWIAKGLGG